MFTASLLTNPETPVLDRVLVESLRNAWGGAEARWLDPGVAAEFDLGGMPENRWQVWADLQQVYRDALARTELDRLCRLINLREGHWLAMQVEEAKIALSAAERTQVVLDRIEPGLVLELSRAAFTAATQGLVERVGGCVAGLLAASGVDRERIDTLYFTGGASGVPQLRARIAAELPRARCVEGDLYGSIGAGLAVEAARRYG